MPRQNQTMHTDLYQLTMMYGYYRAGTHKREAVFDLFFRTGPFGGNHVITAGLEQAIEYIQNLHFSQEDLDYLASLKLFSPDFLDFLRDFTFTGDILAMPEGTVAFPHEPLVRVKAPIYQGQLIETALLAMIGHQSLIATKAARVVQAAEGDPVLEFGLRRAQGLGAGLYGARAAIVGGCAATSNLLAGQVFGVPVSGTHAHSWVMSFPLSSMPSVPMQQPIPMLVYCWLTPTTPCAAEFPMPSSSVRSWKPRGINSWESVSTVATSPICLGKQGRCWTVPDLPMQRSLQATIQMST